MNTCIYLFLITLLLTVSCRITDQKPQDSLVSGNTYVRNVQNPDRFHQNISNAERLNLLRNVEVGDVMSAPGHKYLRAPQNVLEVAKLIKNHQTQDFAREPIILGVFSDEHAGSTRIRSVEVLDGNHRLAAGLYAGSWRKIGDIPQNFVIVHVNGWEAGSDGPSPRWIPLEVAEKSSIPRQNWFRVPHEWGPKDPSAQIPGDIASIDDVIPYDSRGVPMREVLRNSLKKINASIPPWL